MGYLTPAFRQLDEAERPIVPIAKRPEFVDTSRPENQKTREQKQIAELFSAFRKRRVEKDEKREAAEDAAEREAAEREGRPMRKKKTAAEIRNGYEEFFS